MGEENLDRIYIRDLQCRCIVGINQEERMKKQEVIINIVMMCNLTAARKSDKIEDTVDYKGVKTRVLALVENSCHFLLERLADAVAGVCMEEERVQRVEVTIDKPGALRFARSVAVSVVQGR
jgi:D-erythro-7,8-dihydroneopterin triphosphate epimerase